jgi:hypothetical protein
VGDYLSDDLRRLGVVDRLQVLLHCGVIVLFGVEVVAEFPQYNILLRSVQTSFLRQVDCQHIEVALIEDI